MLLIFLIPIFDRCSSLFKFSNHRIPLLYVLTDSITIFKAYSAINSDSKRKRKVMTKMSKQRRDVRDTLVIEFLFSTPSRFRSFNSSSSYFSTLFGTSYPRESITDEEATVDSGIGGEKGRCEEPKSTEGRRVE